MDKRYNIKNVGALNLGYKSPDNLTINLSNYSDHLLQDYDFFPNKFRADGVVYKNTKFTQTVYNEKNNNVITTYEQKGIFGTNNKSQKDNVINYSEFIKLNSLNLTQEYFNNLFFYFNFYDPINITITNKELSQLRVKLFISLGNNVVPLTLTDLEYYDLTLSTNSDVWSTTHFESAFGLPAFNTTDGGISLASGNTYNATTGDSIVLQSFGAGYLNDLLSKNRYSPNGYTFRLKAHTPTGVKPKAIGNIDYKLIIKYFDLSGTIERMSETVIIYQEYEDPLEPTIIE